MIDLLLQPSGVAVVAVIALLVVRRRWVTGVVLAVLVLLAMPAVSQLMLASLSVPGVVGGGPPVGAIVILSADVERVGGGADIGPLTLERERAGANLARRTGLPVLVTGGLVTAPPPVAEMMAASLPADFGVPVRWIENRSLTTWENAQFSVPILKAAGVNRVFLVTHAWHMRRALMAFRRAGMDAVPVAVSYNPVRPTLVVPEPPPPGPTGPPPVETAEGKPPGAGPSEAGQPAASAAVAAAPEQGKSEPAKPAPAKLAPAKPAPAKPEPPQPLPGGGWDLVPRTSAWMRSYYAIHEWVGLLYYTYRS